MKRVRRTMLVGMLLCLCCLLGGCRESTLQTVHTSACELVANGETRSATFYGTHSYTQVDVTQDLVEIVDPSCWKRTTATATDTPYFSVRFPLAKLEFYEGNLLCITMNQTDEQEWYISEHDIAAQVQQYRRQHEYVILPELTEQDEYFAVCR